MTFGRTKAATRGVFRAVAVAATVAVATSIAGCSSADAAGTSDEERTLTIGMAQAVNNLDPATTSPASYAYPAYEPLIYQTPTGDYIPGLATEWELTDDNTKVTLQIREDVKFSDGDDLDAAAVKGSLDYFLSLEDNSLLAAAGPVASVDVTGDSEVTITYSEPYPIAFLSLTQAYNFGLVISPTGVANPESLKTETHGAGQYVLDPGNTVADSQYTFTPNENYWLPDAVKFSSVVLKPITDPAAQLSALQSGAIDYANNVPASNVQTAVDSGFEAATAAGFMWFVMLQARDQAPLNDPQVREAISLAIDRESIADAVFSGLAEPASSIVADSWFGAYDAEPIERDIDRAKELLAEAGYPDGLTITMLDTSALDPDGNFATAIQGQLVDAGITVELQVETGSFDTFLSSLFSGAKQTTAFALPNTDLYYQYMLNIAPGSIANLAGSTDDELSAALTTASTASGDDAEAAYQAVAQRLDELNWLVPVVAAYSNQVHVATLENLAESSVELTPDGFAPDPDLSWEFAD
ncbi:ABC transporter substrate-binding protein [Okibacterium endophyticum]